MEELLEAVSEAVSAMVLYAVEADEKNTSVPGILYLLSGKERKKRQTPMTSYC